MNNGPRSCARRMCGFRRDRRGMAAIEFAIIGMVMMVWIFGMMEVARAFWTYQIMEEVTIEGARCMGIVSSSCASAGAYSASAATSFVVSRAAERGLTITASNVTVTRPATCAGTSGFSSVKITFTFNTAVPLLVPSLSSIPLTATSCYFNVT